MRDDGTEALAAMGGLVDGGQSVFVLQVPEITLPPGFRATKTAKGVQMIATRRLQTAVSELEFSVLGNADAPDMLALATLTNPRPFLTHTHVMGRFIGIRIDGQRAVMAGERMLNPGYTGLSGICTHPDFRGRGLAKRLSITVAAHIEARGDQPFLHAWKSNGAAISLYKQLGFRIRTQVNVALLERLVPAQ